MKISVILLLFLFVHCSKANSQTVLQQETIKTFIQIIDTENIEFADTSAKNNKASVLHPLFISYKTLFSNNDVPKMCRFHPTCGNYGALAVKKYGLLIGTFKTTDRLLRCNNLHYQNQYTYLPSHSKYVDEP
jgi:uncharacterized protein